MIASRPLRERERVQAGLLAAVAQVEQHALGLQPLDHLRAEGRQALVVGHRGAVADRVAAVVGQLDDAHAHLGEQAHAIEFAAQHLGVLEAVDDADLARLGGGVDVGHGRHAAQRPACCATNAFQAVMSRTVSQNAAPEPATWPSVMLTADSPALRASASERASMRLRLRTCERVDVGGVRLLDVGQVGVVQNAQGVDGREAALGSVVLVSRSADRRCAAGGRALACRRSATRPNRS